jgi:hypothetical protein
MSEFKFVQWGKGTPVDYQRLNAMMLNEQYLKDVADRTPRGVLMWKNSAGIGPLNPSGTYQPVTGFTSLLFDVEENRCISFSFHPGNGLLNTTSQLRIRFVVDTTNTADITGGGAYSTGAVYQGYFNAGTAFHIPTAALSKGNHSISVEFVADEYVTSAFLGNDSGMTLVVRDEGAFVSETA